MKLLEKVFLGLGLTIYISVSHAAADYLNANWLSFIKSNFVSSLSVGPSWESAGQAQTLNLAPDVVKTYTTNRPSNSMPSAELFLGIKNELPKQMEDQIGLAFAASGNATLSGAIWDDGNPSFNNYTYQYKVNHLGFSLKGKLIANWNWIFMPWISGSLGVGFNTAYGFNNTPTIYQAVRMPNFASHTITALTYTLGAGLQHQLNQHWQAGVGYEFSDWGKSRLGSASGTGQGLSLSHLYTNSILFNLTYIA